MNIHRVLEIPFVYRVSQFVLAPGMDRIVAARLSRIFATIPRPLRVLDVGCGPSSWLWKLGIKPIGLDLCHAYTERFRAKENDAVTASAVSLPFLAGSFDLVFSYALLHHLPEPLAQQAVEEILRVTRPKGHVILFDPVMPRITALRPLAWALCKLDRGRYIRPQREYENLVLNRPGWKIERFTHSYLGTEGLFSILAKDWAGYEMPEKT
jgi:SAM-dependent methyltransferase